MTIFFPAINFRSILKSVGFSTNTIPLLVAYILSTCFLSGCNKDNSIEDKTWLETILIQPPSLTAQICHYEGTNSIARKVAAAELKKISEILAETNRETVIIREKKRVGSWIEFYRGTNFVSRLSVFDDGIFHFDDYNFRLKSSKPIEKMLIQ